MTIQETTMTVKCPQCGNKFAPEHALEHDIRAQLEREFQEKLTVNSRTVADSIRKQESEKYALKIQMLEQDKTQTLSRLRELETKSIALEQKELDIRRKEEGMEIEMRKRLLDREKLLRTQLELEATEKMRMEFIERERALTRDKELMLAAMNKKVQEEIERTRDEERLRQAELQKKLDDQHRLITEMKRKSEQGSMQLQGEVQELAIEEFLADAFPRDLIEEISKGKRGGDCVHIVRDNYQRVCGKILYESKRTKHFSQEWISKLREDVRLNQADVGVIVTDVLPEGMIRFGEKDGIWICTFPEFKALSYLFRSNLVRIGEVVATHENKGDKMSMIYSYVTGTEFRQKLEAAFESYNEMQEDLIREKSLFMSQWAKREKKLLKAMENLVCLYGDVRGIAGGAVQEIKSLEMPQLNLLYNQ